MTTSKESFPSLLSAAELAHQIKNPITALNLQLDELAEVTANSDLAQLSQNALLQLQRINNLVDSILATWQVSNDHDLAEIDLTKLIEDVLLEWQPKFHSANRTYQFIKHEELFILGSPEIEFQVIEVLLDNALKHGAGNLDITVTRNGNWAIVEFQDEGPGISESIRERLMTFGATTNGNGFGLAWARNQIISEGGQLEMKSMEPAIFCLHLLLSPLKHELT
jgi:signal transduction histidine kinase